MIKTIYYHYAKQLVSILSMHLNVPKYSKILTSIVYDFFKIIIFIYFITISILLYIGPLETKIVTRELQKNPVDIIVSLASTPYRINTIKPVLDSIARQSIKPSRIYLNLPLKSLIYPDKKFVIPEWLKNYPNIIINRTEQDYGPATKLIPTLKKELNPNTIIVTIDDDRLYPKHMLRDLIKKTLPGFYNKLTKEAVITGLGISFVIEPKSLKLYPLLRWHFPNKKTLTMHGSYGVAYRRNFFNNDIFALFNNLSIECFLTDDLVIPSYLAANNIDIINLYGGSFSYNPIMLKLAFQELPTSKTPDAIKFGANGKTQLTIEKKIVSCLTNLLYNGKETYHQAIVRKSNTIYSLYNNTFIFLNKIRIAYFVFILDIINIIPGIKKLFIYTMI